jgi:signal transduction histidine kinase
MSSAGAAILSSSDRTILRAPWIGRPADDTAALALYGEAMRSRLDPRRVDRALAVLLLAGVELEVWIGGDGSSRHRVVAAVVGALVTGSLAVRRRFPRAVGFGVQGLLVADLFLSGHLPAGPVTVAWFCALYALTVWTSSAWFAAGVAFFAATNLVPEALRADNADTVVTFTAVAVVVMLLVRRVLGDRDRRVELAERERDLAAREAVVEERARIARELHDAIAHNVSLMVVQAGAERRVLDPAGGSTRDVLETIEQIGRGALTEMRRLVGMLRSDARDSLVPQPGLGDLPRLVAQIREAGLPVELTIAGERRELPVGIELSAYRIVQEALTNALKHAGDASASVRVRYGADSLDLEVFDDGRGAAPPVPSGGHGLVGMRERVALYGGRFDAGRQESGGFGVRVVLPIR